MLSMRERPLAPVGRINSLAFERALAPLPSLRDALQRRAAIFGPFDADPAPVASRGPLARLAAKLRALADLVEPARVAT